MKEWIIKSRKLRQRTNNDASSRAPTCLHSCLLTAVHTDPMHLPAVTPSRSPVHAGTQPAGFGNEQRRHLTLEPRVRPNRRRPRLPLAIT